MASPELVHNYPASGDTGFPVGEKIRLYFSNCVDPKTAKDSIILVGNVRDRAHGPGMASLVSPKVGDDRFFLKSPGFSGTVPLKMEFGLYRTDDSDREIVSGALPDRDAEVAGPYASVVTIWPEGGSFAADTIYTLYVNGDPESTGIVGVSCKTVYDVVPDPANASTTGVVKVSGTYTGDGDDTVVVVITTAGDPGGMKYKWWFDSAGEPSATMGKVSSRRYRLLDEGLQIRFDGSEFEVGDRFEVQVYSRERMETSSNLTFTTNDGTWSEAPGVSSIPASTVPAVTDLIETEATYLTVIEMDPEHQSYNNKNNLRRVWIKFSEELDADTVTKETVELWKLPVSGHYNKTYRPERLEFELEVDGDEIVLKF